MNPKRHGEDHLPRRTKRIFPNHNILMKIIGLTGGVGMGKTTAADLLRERGVRVVDTDEIARQITAPGQPALAEIRAALGDEFFAADGALLRAALAEKVFSDAPARRRLEAILHPRIRVLWQEQVARWRAEGVRLAVVVIPLLFEIAAQAEFDLTVCLGCSATIQHQRLLSRGWSSEQIARRQQAQLPLEKKMAAANHVLWNDGDRLALAAQLDRLLAATALVEGVELWPTDNVLEKLTGFPHRYFPNRLENPPGTLPAGRRA